MAKVETRKCHVCSGKVTKSAAREEKAKNPVTICEVCLDTIYPERGNKPVLVDKDANIYIIDKDLKKIIIIFSYGAIPYSSFTEVDASEDPEGCGGLFLLQR